MNAPLTPAEASAARRRARVPPAARARQDLDHADQAAVQPARPVAGLFARRGLRLPGDRGGPGAGGRVHLARQPGRRGHQRHRGARPGRHRPAGRQAGDGRQGLPVQEVRRHRRLRHRTGRDATPTSWSTSSPRWSPRWAASTSRTSRRRSASTSRRSCASGSTSRCSTTTSTAPRSSPPRRCSTGWNWWARRSARSRSRSPAPAPRPSPAWT